MLEQLAAMATPTVSVWQFLILVLGVYSPRLIAFAQNPLWPAWRKVAMTWGIHFCIALVYLGSTGLIKDTQYLLQNFITVAGQLFIYSWLSYAGIWKPQQINEKATLLRTKTLRKLGIGPKVNPLSPNDKLIGEKD